MLNCTDLECILHQHHYHHHLHQLHHLHQDGHHAGAGDPASDGDDVLRLLNSTDGELSGLSHLDAPISDSVYIVCGVLIAMVLVGLIIVLLAITISKLRKREETNNNNNNGGLRHGGQREHGRQLPQLQQLQLQVPDGGKAAFTQGHPGSNGVAILETTVATTTIAPTVGSPDSGIGSDLSPGPEDGDGDAGSADGKVSGAPLELFLWSYPSQQHGHELEHPLQRAAISAAKDALVRPLPPEAPQDSKGLRKNLRGKWKRLVKRKPEDTGSIPPELRDQLKQIYVY